SLEERISKLVAENDILRREDTEIKFENNELKAENVKLKQALEEHESRFAKLEQNDKDTAVENAELKVRVAKLEQKQSKTDEKNNFIIKSDDDAKEINQSSVCEAGYPVSNTISTKMKNSNDTPASNISDNTSNSDVAPEQIENSSNITSDSYIIQEKDSRSSTSLIPIENGNTLEEKAIDKFLDSKHRETVRSSLSVKGGQGLIQELFTPEPSLQESNIIQNHVIEISETAGPGKSNIDEASQHLAQLCDKAFDAEDGANRANQEEILCWSIYGKDFRKYRGMLYAKKLRAEKIYILFEKIGHDKIKHIKSYSANSISKLTNNQIQEIINYSCQNVDTDNARHQISSENTEISETAGPGKISSEIKTGNITTPSISLSHTPNSEDKIIEKVESLPETGTKVSISIEPVSAVLEKVPETEGNVGLERQNLV
ncbi:3204_t:CDS:2, partial [Paraglomus occultum]